MNHLPASAPALVCGGHSFISQLGTDAPLSASGIRALVRACLDAGITRFDTTYQPERVALGRALQELDARNNVEILAWNFFDPFGPGDDVSAPGYYLPHHLEIMLGELRTDRIDGLVVHALQNPEENARQLKLAQVWQAGGTVKSLGTWNPAAADMAAGSPYSFMVKPYNVRTAIDAAPAFAAAGASGISGMACSPFVRGWMLDAMLENAVKIYGGASAELQARLSDHLLRFSLYAPGISALIVAMRNTAWVTANTASLGRGPLNAAEREWLGTISTALPQ